MASASGQAHRTANPGRYTGGSQSCIHEQYLASGPLYGDTQIDQQHIFFRIRQTGQQGNNPGLGSANRRLSPSA